MNKNQSKADLRSDFFRQMDTRRTKGKKAAPSGGIQSSRHLPIGKILSSSSVSAAELETQYQHFQKLFIEAEQAYRQVETMLLEDEQRYREAEQCYMDAFRQFRAVESFYITTCHAYQDILKTAIQNPSVPTETEDSHATHSAYIQAHETYQEAVKSFNNVWETYKAARETYKNSMQAHQEVEETYLEVFDLSHKTREMYVENLESQLQDSRKPSN